MWTQERCGHRVGVEVWIHGRCKGMDSLFPCLLYVMLVVGTTTIRAYVHAPTQEIYNVLFSLL